MTKQLFKIFGRVTGTKEQIFELLSFFKKENALACFETADESVSSDHSHFIVEQEWSSMKNLREAFKCRCQKVLGKQNQYSLKPYKEDLDAEAYICKGWKKDSSLQPTILINTMNIDVTECHERFHRVARDRVYKNGTKAVWTEIMEYIKQVDDSLFNTKFSRAVEVRIASHMFDWYMSKGRMIQGKYVQQMILQTIVANAFKDKTIKRSIISTWLTDCQYFNGVDTVFYEDVEDVFNSI